MSGWPPIKCATCGTETPMLAQVSDPFLDSCYGVCRDCLSYLHERWNRQVFGALTGFAGSNDALRPAVSVPVETEKQE